MSAEFESGLFVKRPAWHQQGVVLEDYPDIKTAYCESGLNWVVDKRMLVLPVEKDGEYKPTDSYAVVRNKDDRILGYVGNRYVPFQNFNAFTWMKPLVDSGMWNIETAGSLKGGEICWALMRQGEIEIVPNDVLKEYLLFTWSHNGKLTNMLQPTMIRVVCQNTLQASLTQGGCAKIVHTSSIKDKMQFVQSIFAQSSDSFRTETEVFKRLLDKTITDSLIEQVIDEFYGLRCDEDNASESAKECAKRRIQKATRHVYEIASGRDLGVNYTAYGLFQALSEFNEHYFLTKKQDAGYNILFGNGAELNKNILKRLAA